MQTSKRDASDPLTVGEFYDRLAPSYDEMTGFERRFLREKPFFQLLVERHGIKKALDAGCGSGFHSLLLSQLGVQVTAIDASKEMVRLTREHARVLGLSLTVVSGSFHDLTKIVSGPFDAAFVMGNSLAHLLSSAELKKSLQNFASLLAPHGILFTQNLNYERILRDRQRVQSSKEEGTKTFVRVYDYDEDGILFSILTLEKESGALKQKIETIRLRPVLRTDLVDLLSGLGFEEISVFGGITMEPFDPMTSKDLVILAKKRT
jgi:SAM-dependent methyltransferase